MDKESLDTVLKAQPLISNVRRAIMCDMLDDPTTGQAILSMLQALYDGLTSGTVTDVVKACEDILYVPSLEELLTANDYIPEDAKKELLSLPKDKVEVVLLTQ